MPTALETKEWLLTLVHEDKYDKYTTGYVDHEARDAGMRHIMISVLDRQGTGTDKLYAAIQGDDPTLAIGDWEGVTGEYLYKDDIPIMKLITTMEVMRESITD